MSANPSSSAADRFGVTFLFSLIAHAVIVLGITFSVEIPAPSLPALDVILVQSASGQAPDKADFLAQASNSGGGEAEKARRPTDPLSSPIPKPRGWRLPMSSGIASSAMPLAARRRWIVSAVRRSRSMKAARSDR